MSGLEGVLERAGATSALPAGSALLRAWPQDDLVVLELRAGDGSLVGARWVPGSARVEVVDPAADRRLPGLAPLLTAGATLVGYRTGRRAVVAVRSGAATSYVKVVRPSRVAATAARHDLVVSALAGPATPAGAPALPARFATDERSGTFELERLDGEPLPRLLARGPVVAAGAGDAVGRAMRAWWGAAPPAGLPHHDAAAEHAVLAGWAERAAGVAVVDGSDLRRWRLLVERAQAALHALPVAPSDRRLLHRDLHPGQLLVTAAGGVGLIDLDTASTGDPAVDLGNLLAHVDLEVAAGRCPAASAAVFEAALRAGVGTVATSDGAVRAYRLATLARLVGVHAFRPGADVLVPALLDRADVGGWVSAPFVTKATRPLAVPG